MCETENLSNFKLNQEYAVGTMSIFSYPEASTVQ
jgi:hypothetical protein